MGLDFVELVMRTEEVFGIDLPDKDCGAVRTVGDLYKLVLAKLGLPYMAAVEAESHSAHPTRFFRRASEPYDWTTAEVWITLKAVIHDHLGISPTRITECAKFVDDFGCD